MRRYAILSVAVLILFGCGLFSGNRGDPATSALARQNPSTPPTPPVQVDEAAALRARIEVLERELKAARTRIAQLEAELAAAKAQPPTGAAPAEGGSQAEEPASPHHLLARLKTEFAEHFPEPPPSDPRELRQHVRSLTQWVNMVNRERRQRIDWVCRIVSRDLIDADRAYVDLESIDPVTGEALSERFVIEWPRRLRPLLARFEDGAPVRLRGLLTPDVRVNESRPEPGTFDIPPLIGPFVEFRYATQVTALSAVEIGPPPADPLPPDPVPTPEPQR